MPRVVHFVFGILDHFYGSRFSTFIKGKSISRYIGRELGQKLENPLIFQGQPAGANIAPQKIYGYDVTILIDICNVILAAQADGQLRDNQSLSGDSNPDARSLNPLDMPDSPREG